MLFRRIFIDSIFLSFCLTLLLRFHVCAINYNY